jgi:hypothetical protein
MCPKCFLPEPKLLNFQEAILAALRITQELAQKAKNVTQSLVSHGRSRFNDFLYSVIEDDISHRKDSHQFYNLTKSEEESSQLQQSDHETSIEIQMENQTWMDRIMANNRYPRIELKTSEIFRQSNSALFKTYNHGNTFRQFNLTVKQTSSLIILYFVRKLKKIWSNAANKTLIRMKKIANTTLVGVRKLTSRIDSWKMKSKLQFKGKFISELRDIVQADTYI